METVQIGIGSNLGHSIDVCETAVQRLNDITGIQVYARSGWYYTEPFGQAEQPWFVNGALSLKTSLTPFQLLDVCYQLEKLAGRTASSKWGPRILDIDILMWENRVIVSRMLTLPHRWLHRRRFVLTPLSDIASGNVHPLTGKTIRSLLQNVPDTCIVRPYKQMHGDI